MLAFFGREAEELVEVLSCILYLVEMLIYVKVCGGEKNDMRLSRGPIVQPNQV